MAKTSRTKEIWHIPKRGNVHQTIYMVNLLTWDKFLQKSWSNQKQEMIASEMGKAGLTESGKAISHQSVRTLLANLPKYLGFVYIDESSTPSKVVVTDAGYELLRVHDIESIKKHKNLREYKDAGDLIDISPMFEKQMIKLIITNPTIKRDCENILVFPFRLTLKLLLELEYLDMEEIAYILFHSKNEDEQELLKQRILNFRNLSPDSRSKEIGAYRSTEEGNLTLVKAPSAGYYMYLCCSTGICSRDVVKVNKIGKNKLTAIKLIDKDKAQALLSNYSNISAYDFRDNMKLWMEYFANPNIIEPPFKLEICTNSDTDILVVVKKGEDIIGSDILGITNKSLNIEVFSEAKYTINVYELSTGKKISEDTFTASKDATVYAINPISGNSTIKNVEEYANLIQEMFTSNNGFDNEYSEKLNVILEVLGKNFLDNRRKGGRLEYLFYKILQKLKDNHIVDEVFWFGKEGQYGIAEPAPGGKEGNPDIVFELEDTIFVVELTTYRGNRAQWNSSEASSVPDHIRKAIEKYPTKKVIGIFSAPSIHEQLEHNLWLNAKNNNVGMVFINCLDFANLLIKKNRGEIKETLNNLVLQQLNR